jgi:hypothetical protein
MSRGPGTAQRAILAALADAVRDYMTVPELAQATGRGERQVRAAVRALEGRALVVITREYTGWRGTGEYGRLVALPHWNPDQPELEPVLTVHAGERHPGRPGWVAARDVQFGRAGMPTYGLLVFLPERHEAREARYRAAVARFTAILAGEAAAAPPS